MNKLLNSTLFLYSSISVIDDVGAESPSIDVSIVLCNGCGSNGRCSYDNIIPSENDRFSLAVCECDIGYSGKTNSSTILKWYILDNCL